MPNTIKTSADKIVEKHHSQSIKTDSKDSIVHAILEVEACIAEMVLLGDKVGDIHIGFYGEDRIKELELLKQELKSRIV